MRARAWFAVALPLWAACALACGGGGEVIAPPAVVVVADGAPHAAPQSRQEVVAAYLADCAAVFRADVDPEMSDYDVSDECMWREFDQNCSPDPSGCWDAGQTCLDACGSTCGDCQAACATTCGTCKEACGADEACVTACAESRADCRDACTGARATCMNDTCPDAGIACNDAWEAKKVATCPNCAEMLTCSEEAFRAGDTESRACQARFAGAASECFEWCSVLWQ